MARWQDDLVKNNHYIWRLPKQMVGRKKGAYGWRLATTIVILVLAVVGVILIVKATRKKESTPQVVEQKPTVSIRTSAETFAPVAGWYQNKGVEYYDFGKSNRSIGNVYVLATSFDTAGNPVKVAGQGDIYDTDRGTTDYSDFRQVQFVTVPSDYQANSVKSVSEIKSNNWLIKDSGKIENRPQVLADDRMDPDRPKEEGWYNGHKVYTWIFETDVPRDPADKTRILTGKSYTFISGFDAKGDPIPFPSQKNVFESIPDVKNYSPLVSRIYVQVPSTYVAESVKSADEILKNNYVTRDSGYLINDPIYSAETSVASEAPGPTSEALPMAEGNVKSSPRSSISGLFPPYMASTYPSFSSEMPPEFDQGVPTQEESILPSELTAFASAAGQPVLAGAPLPAETVSVSIENQSFQPNAITISPISTVIWTNNDSVEHTVTFDTIDIDSGPIPPGGTYSLIFLNPGEYTYHCDFHSEMFGEVLVAE